MKPRSQNAVPAHRLHLDRAVPFRRPWPLLVPVLTALLAGPLSAANESQIEWVGSFERAVDLARETARPLFVAINMDDEPANDRMAQSTYHNRDLVRLTQGAVPLIASASYHGSPHAEVGADGRRLCPRFGHVTCEEHQEVEREVRRRWFVGRSVIVAPQHIVADLGACPIQVREYELSRRELCEFVEEGLAFPLVGRQANDHFAKHIARQVKALGSTDDHKRERALCAVLLGLSYDRFDVTMAVIRKKASKKTREQLVRRLIDIGPLADRALSEFLADSASTVRLAAVEAFEASPHYLRAARQRLTELADSERSRRVRTAIRRALD